MTRMIERWFPCQEVSENSEAGWGSGNVQKALFTWFAARPAAQAKAAVVCSLLPWPDDPSEQRRLQNLVRRSLKRRDSSDDKELSAELGACFPDGATMLDPYSGRAMIPYEAARLGVKAWGIDYSPVATLGGSLLAQHPLRSWDAEPDLPYEEYQTGNLETFGQPRLLRDVRFVLQRIGRELDRALAAFYPKVEGRQPWGYLWAVSLPCVNCGNRFPLIGSLALRPVVEKRGDQGQSLTLVVDKAAGTFRAIVEPGGPTRQPTLVSTSGRRGKTAVCPFCDHPHDKDVHTRLMRDQFARDELLLAADLDDQFSKSFREATVEERDAVMAAERTLAEEPDFALGLPAVPEEQVPAGNNDTVRPSMYGYSSYGAFCNARQTLAFVKTARLIDRTFSELVSTVSRDYAAALSAYAASAMVRRMRRSTRGAYLQIYNDGRPTGVMDVFTNEASIGFSYDYFEAGIGTDAAGTWPSICTRTLSSLEAVLDQSLAAKPALCVRGSAASLAMADSSLDAVVTDPPYDSMIDYSDASDLFFVWLKRALVNSHPDFGITSHPLGVQEKDEETIVKRGGKAVNDFRTDEHYDRLISAAFREARRKVKDDGVVTVVFGHGDPDVWHRLLMSISAGGLVLTGSWPARTEKGGKAGSANIETTLTLACRPAADERPTGRVSEVDAEVRREIMSRIPLWDVAGLALTDQLMASAGPAMEVVGRYSVVLDKAGRPVDLDRYLPLARRFVEEAADIKVDTLPLETFDERTRFALFWVRLYGRGVAAGSEARWQRLASDLSDDDTAGLMMKAGKGVRFAYASEAGIDLSAESPVIDVALAVAAAGKSVASVAEVLVSVTRTEDPFVWAAMGELSRLVPEADADGDVWTWVVRNRGPITGASRNVEAAKTREVQNREASSRQTTLFGGDD